MAEPDQNDPAAAMVAACRLLYDAIDRLDAVAAERVGISRNDLRALNMLEHGPIKPRALAEGLGLTTGAVTSLIDRLEGRGLVRRAPDPKDRRGVLVEPTEAMLTALAPLYRSVARGISGLAVTYGEAEARVAAQHLHDVAAAYGKATSEASER